MKRPTVILVALATAVLVAGCGGEIEVPQEEAGLHRGAELFNERCSGCHSLEAANSFGSNPEGEIQKTERTNGPDFNVRQEQRSDVLFAIRNGGFSGGIMPANIVVGDDAHAVADFVAKYSGGADPEDDLTDTGSTPGG